MILDIITFAVLASAVFRGLERGLILSVFSFASLLIGLLVAMMFSATATKWLEAEGKGIPAGWLPFLSFLLVFAAAGWLVGLAGKMLKGFAKVLMLGWIDGAAGVLLHVALYGLVYSILLFYLGMLGIPGASMISESSTYGWIAPLGPGAISLLSEAIPLIGNFLQELQKPFKENGYALPVPVV